VTQEQASPESNGKLGGIRPQRGNACTVLQVGLFSGLFCLFSPGQFDLLLIG
jgi:hypothetical protein